MLEQERRIVKLAVLYDLRLIIKRMEKENYTKKEILDLLDTIAAAKEQE